MARNSCRIRAAIEDAEYRLDLFSGEEIAVLAERVAFAPVVTVFAIVQSHLHEAAKGNRPRAADFLRERLRERGHRAALRISLTMRLC